ncbi:MAG: response regulator transcription factor [Rubrivivax sp.]|nr:response regulator transcription factor [Rubrivivax sp.]
MNAAKVLLVEPNVLLREGLRALINSQPDLAVCGEAADGPAAIRLVATEPPSLVLCELAFQGTPGMHGVNGMHGMHGVNGMSGMSSMSGIEAIADIRRRCPHLGILVLTALRAPAQVREALAAGANGFLVKDTSFGELLIAMRSVLRGRTYLSPEVSGHVVQRYLDPRQADGAGSQFDQLTRRERSILRLVAEGHTNRDAAAALKLSQKTVEKHRASMMRKLGLRNVAELAVLALEAGVIERPAAVMRAVDGYRALAGAA